MSLADWQDSPDENEKPAVGVETVQEWSVMSAKSYKMDAMTPLMPEISGGWIALPTASTLLLKARSLVRSW